MKKSVKKATKDKPKSVPVTKPTKSAVNKPKAVYKPVTKSGSIRLLHSLDDMFGRGIEVRPLPLSAVHRRELDGLSEKQTKAIIAMLECYLPGAVEQALQQAIFPAIEEGVAAAFAEHAKV